MTHTKFIHLLFFSLIFFNLSAFAGKLKFNSSRIEFLENKGQLKNHEGKQIPDVFFKIESPNLDIYISQKGLSYVFKERIDKEVDQIKTALQNNIKGEAGIDFSENISGKEIINAFQLKDKEGAKFRYLRSDMDLVNADIKIENIIKEEESKYYNNYFLSNCPQGIYNVHYYNKITIKNVYPGIDWMLYTNGEELKYDFIVNAGSNPSDIQLLYRGFTDIEIIDSKSINLKTLMGEIQEENIFAYQINKENPIDILPKIQIIPTKNLPEYLLTFEIGKYDLKNELVIDPKLKWGTYFGGAGGLEGAFAIDADGKNVFISGYAGSSDFPASPSLTPGAYFQPTASAQNDAFIAQFDSAGVRKWATFYGGEGTDFAAAMHSDGTNLFVTGLTGSSTFPLQDAGGGAYYQSAFVTTLGAYRTFILKFDLNGVRKWGTFYGGTVSPTSIGTGIKSDGTDVFITGFVSESDFPLMDAGNGAYYQSTKSPGMDAYILKFSVNGIRKWATYYGGNGAEGGLFPRNATPGLSLDNNFIWIAGTTTSTNFPINTQQGNSFFQASNAGLSDVYILKFNKQGKRLWSSLIGGSSEDIGNAIASDGKNVWVTGSSFSSDFPSVDPQNGAYFQGIRGGNSDPILLKFDTSGVLIWSTYIGGSEGNSRAYGVAADANQVWIAGEVSTDWPIFDPKDCSPIYRTVTGGSEIGYMQFTHDGYPLYSSYYGGPGGDWCTSIDLEPGTGNAYMTGEWTGQSSNNPTVNPGNGAYYQSSMVGGVSDDSFILKFGKPCPCTTPIPSIKGPLAACLGDSISITAGGGTSYTWSNGASGATIKIKIIKDTLLTATVINSCGSRTISQFVKMRPLPIAKVIGNTDLCKGEQINIGGIQQTGISYNWTSVPAGFTSNLSNPTVKPSSTTNYKLIVRNGFGCLDSAVVQINILELPIANAGQDKFVSCDQKTNLSGSASGGVEPYSFRWLQGPNQSNYSNVGSGRYILIVTDAKGCKNFDTVDVFNSNSDIKVELIISKSKVCLGDSIIIEAKPTGGVGSLNYNWSEPEFNNSKGPFVYYPKGNKSITVEVSDQNNCKFQDLKSIEIAPTPIILISKNDSICFGDSILLSANGAIDLTWRPSIGLNTNKGSFVKASPSKTTTYTVIGKNEYGCIDSNKCTINVYQKPVLILSPDIEICENASTLLEVSGADTYQWSPSKGLNVSTGNKVIASPKETTTYKVVGENSTGCKSTKFVKVAVFKLPKAIPSYTKKSLKVNFMSDSNNSIQTFTWDFGDRTALSNLRNPSHEYLQMGTYTIQLIVENKCGLDTNYFDITIDSTNGIETMFEDAFDIQLFPNPMIDVLNIKIKSNSNQKMQYKIVDILGREIIQEQRVLIFSNKDNIIRIPETNIKTKGIYFFIVGNEKRNYGIEFIKQ